MALRVKIPGYKRRGQHEAQSQGNLTVEDIAFIATDALSRFNNAYEGCQLADQANQQWRMFGDRFGRADSRDAEAAQYALFNAMFINKHIASLSDETQDKYSNDRARQFENPDVRFNSNKSIYFTYPDLVEWGKNFYLESLQQEGLDETSAREKMERIAGDMQNFIDSNILRTPINLARALEDGLQESPKSDLIREALRSMPKTSSGETSLVPAMNYMIGAEVSGNPQLRSYASELMAHTIRTSPLGIGKGDYDINDIVRKKLTEAQEIVGRIR